jgi:hypothetical protein
MAPGCQPCELARQTCKACKVTEVYHDGDCAARNSTARSGYIQLEAVGAYTDMQQASFLHPAQFIARPSLTTVENWIEILQSYILQPGKVIPDQRGLVLAIDGSPVQMEQLRWSSECVGSYYVPPFLIGDPAGDCDVFQCPTDSMDHDLDATTPCRRYS